MEVPREAPDAEEEVALRLELASAAAHLMAVHTQGTWRSRRAARRAHRVRDLALHATDLLFIALYCEIERVERALAAETRHEATTD